MSTSSVRSLDQGLGLECSEGRASATQVRLRSAATLVSLPQSALASRTQIVLEPELMELALAGLALAAPPQSPEPAARRRRLESLAFRRPDKLKG
jgi:hypothetical protein